jgi:GntR family transcriptional regulator, transcriptional repressor for pyruvate dehydrogenase complex
MSINDRDVAPGRYHRNHETWGPVLPTTLSSQIVHHIRGAIFERKLHPGEFLGTEASLAEGFGVSRMAARDAVRSLQALGLVTIRKGAGGGITIAEGDPDRLSEAMAIQLLLLGVSVPDLLDAQFAIELLIGELAAQAITKSELEHLQTIIANAEKKTNDIGPFLDLIFDFHVGMARASHNPALAIPLRAYMDALRPYYRQATTHERAVHVVNRYRELIELLARKDKNAASALLTRHQREIRRSLLQEREPTRR